MFSGIAIGGPLDGKAIDCESPRYKVAEQRKLMPFVSFKDTLDAAEICFDTFEYEYFKYGSLRAWVPMQVIRGERYEHKIYEHPMDFVFSKLLRGYRPEGY